MRLGEVFGAGRARERVLRETAERRVRNCMVVVVGGWLFCGFGLVEVE
jgi:hypothetical protein